MHTTSRPLCATAAIMLYSCSIPQSQRQPVTCTCLTPYGFSLERQLLQNQGLSVVFVRQYHPDTQSPERLNLKVHNEPCQKYAAIGFLCAGPVNSQCTIGAHRPIVFVSIPIMPIVSAFGYCFQQWASFWVSMLLFLSLLLLLCSAKCLHRPCPMSLALALALALALVSHQRLPFQSTLSR